MADSIANRLRGELGSLLEHMYHRNLPALPEDGMEPGYTMTAKTVRDLRHLNRLLGEAAETFHAVTQRESRRYNALYDQLHPEEAQEVRP